MEPVVNKILQGIPFAGMGTELERNGLIGVVRNLIKANKYTVDYILNYCESVGYQRNMTEEVFEELTGISPKLIINNNEYYDAPIYVPACTIAWGLAKTKPNVAFYVVPGSYGYSVMEKNETDVPTEIIQTATIPEAIDELKKVAKKIQTLDKIITSKLLETEDIATIATDPNQTDKPYAAVDPIFELKKNFKNRVIDINGFEKEAKKLVAEDKISLEEAEDLLNWEQDMVNEDESYANEVLQNNEEWKPLEAVEDIPFDKIYEEFKAISSEDEDILGGKEKAEILYRKNKTLFKDCDLLQCAERLYQLMLGFNKEEILGHSKVQKKMDKQASKKVTAEYEDLDSFDYTYSLLVNGNIDLYKKRLNKMSKVELMDYIVWAEEMGISREKLKLHYITASKKVTSSKIIQVNVYDIDWNFDELDEEDKPTEKLPDFYNNLNIEIDEDAEDFKMTKDDIENMIDDSISKELFNEFGYYPESYNWTYSNKKSASKKVTAENITLEDMEEEDNKSESEKEVEKINETPINELLEDNTPLDFFEKETQDDKVDTINDVVSKCITEFSDKFKDFSKYDIKMLSYKTKILNPYTPTQDEMIPDNEVNADAVLQVILSVNNKADDNDIKKLLVVFSITDGKMHWTGTVRDEDNNIVAFTEEGLDSIFNEPEEITEDII